MKLLSIAIIIVASLLVVSCSKTTVQKSDFVQVTYTGAYANGTIFDTNDPKLQSVFAAPASHFSPLTVRMGAHQVIPGFENALLGMAEGESKSVRIKPQEAYGTYDAGKVTTVPKRVIFPREINVQRTIPISIDELTLKIKDEASVGKIFETQNFFYNITSVNATHAMLYLLNATHNPVQLEGALWNSTKVRENASTITFSHIVANGTSFDTPNGPYRAEVNSSTIVMHTLFAVGQQFNTPQGQMRVTRESSESVTLDFNHPLAGNELVFNITVNTIQS